MPLIERPHYWTSRAVEATRLSDPLMLCFVLAILGLQHACEPPRFGSKARINKEGMVFSHMQDKNGRMYRDHCLGHIDTIISNFRHLADYLKLTDKDRIEMFSELRKWFVVDERANQTPKERGLIL